VAGLFALLFLVVPLVELFLILQVGQALGAGPTIALLLVMSVAGGWLMKREGLGLLRRIQAMVQRGEVPGRELVDAFLVLLGGALMLTPGFLTDVVGLSLLLPPVRAVVRRAAAARLTVMAVGQVSGRPGRQPPRSGGDGVIDV
jgi:UPF0716 protein FxsA